MAGLSDARNVGIDVCRGEYIVFIDSDDYVNQTMIEKLYKNIKSNQSDISICGFYSVINNTLEEEPIKERHFCTEGIEKFDYLYNEFYVYTVVAWNKLYKRDLFEKNRYEKGKLHEDEFIICDLLDSANKISYMLEPLYYYQQRNGSITSKFNIKRFDIIDALEKRYQFFKKIDSQENMVRTLTKEFRQLDTLLMQAKAIKTINNDEMCIINNYYTKFKNVARQLLKNGNIAKNVKVKCHIAARAPKLYINVVRKIKRR